MVKKNKPSTELESVKPEAKLEIKVSPIIRALTMQQEARDNPETARAYLTDTIKRGQMLTNKMLYNENPTDDSEAISNADFLLELAKSDYITAELILSDEPLTQILLPANFSDEFKKIILDDIQDQHTEYKEVLEPLIEEVRTHLVNSETPTNIKP